jgi:hypothetical protein
MTATASSKHGLSAREERLVRLLERASASSRFSFSERWLFALGGAAVIAGFVLVVIGWAGASDTVLVAGQIPYLISGGLIGLGLIFVGGFLYFGRWMAVLTRENREIGSEDRNDLAQLREGIDQLNRTLSSVLDAIASPAGRPLPARRSSSTATALIDGPPSDDTPAGVPALVATAQGSMMHRPDCPVVAGRDNLRPVTPDEGLKPCGICRPLDPRSS